ncbi:MAG: hypothetical protein QXU32_05220 [Nitrososphaerales archaeon]
MVAIKKILVFGNPLVKKDSLPLKLAVYLQKEFADINFQEFDAVEDLHKEGRTLYLLDAVEGIEHVEVITDIDRLLTSKIYSVHDFDLAHTLKLMKKMQLIDNVTIFGVPMKIRMDQAIREIKAKITSILLSKSG